MLRFLKNAAFLGAALNREQHLLWYVCVNSAAIISGGALILHTVLIKGNTVINNKSKWLFFIYFLFEKCQFDKFDHHTV